MQGVSRFWFLFFEDFVLKTPHLLLLWRLLGEEHVLCFQEALYRNILRSNSYLVTCMGPLHVQHHREPPICQAEIHL